MRRRLGVGLVAAVVLGGLVVWPGSPAAADEVTYEDVPCELRFASGSTFNDEFTWTMSADGPSEPVAPGETFTLSDLVVIMHEGFIDHAGELTVLGGQVINLGIGENTSDTTIEWAVGDVELTAPTEFGTHGINPEATWNRSPTSGASFLGYFCPREGESFPDEPFAFVEVADVDPTPTTTTTVPANGNGDGNGNGDDPNGNGDDNGGVNGGVDPDAEFEAELDAEAELEAEVEALEAEAALLVGASPRFAG